MSEQKEKGWMSKVWNKVLYGFTDHMDIIGRPLTDNSVQRMTDNPSFKAAAGMALLNLSTQNDPVVGSVVAVAILAANIGLQKISYAAFDAGGPETVIVNKNPSAEERVSAMSTDVSAYYVEGFSDQATQKKIAGLLVETALMFCVSEIGIMKASTLLAEGFDPLYGAGLVVCGCAVGCASHLIGHHFRHYALMHHLMTEEWILQPFDAETKTKAEQEGCSSFMPSMEV